MPNTEGSVVRGAYSYGNIPSALFKYDKDKDYAGMVIYIQREIATLTHLIREKLPRVNVESRTPVLPEVTERDYLFNVASAATPEANNMVETWSFPNTAARNFQKDDFLQVRGHYINTSLATPVWSTTFTATAGSQEVVRILEVGSSGGTNTNVIVQRGWGSVGTGTPTTVSTTAKLVLVTSAVGEGSRSRQSVGKNITTIQNYVQRFREPYEATDFEMEEDLFFKERPEQTNANLASLLLMKKIEFSMWAGIQAQLTDSQTNKTMFTMGGVIDYIPKDANHQINYNGVLTAPGLNSVFKDILSLGGSTERWAFGGYSAVVALNNAYDQKIRLNMPLSERYGIKINTIETSIGGLIHVVPSFALTELGYDWDFFVLDFGTPQAPYLQYMYIQDIYINTGPNGKGIQANDEFIRKEEFVGDIGLIRRAAPYQAHIFGITQSL